jgi:hypothetical protein
MDETGSPAPAVRDAGRCGCLDARPIECVFAMPAHTDRAPDGSAIKQSLWKGSRAGKCIVCIKVIHFMHDLAGEW